MYALPPFEKYNPTTWSLPLACGQATRGASPTLAALSPSPQAQ